MELPPLQQQLISQLSQNLKGQNLLNEQLLSPGTRLQAQVEMIAKVTPELRARLMTLLSSQASATGEVKKNNDHTKPALDQNGLKPPSATQQKLGALLKQQQLFAVQLKILGKSLLTFSATPLDPKDRLNVIVREDKQLQLLKTPNNETSTPIKSKETLQNTATQTPLSKSHTSQQPAALKSYGNSLGPLPLDSKSAVLRSALRHYMPAQKPVADGVTNVQSLISASKSSPPNSIPNDISKLVQRLSTLITTSPTIAQLSQPQSLKNSITQSGVFLEPRLANILSRASSLNTSLTTSASNDRSGNGVKTPATSPTTNPFKTDRSNSLELNPQDIKAELLKLINDVESLSKTVPTDTKKADGNIDKLIRSFFSFSAEQKAKPLMKEMPQNAAARIAAAIQPSLFAALARISTLQLHRLTHIQQEGGVSTFGSFLELPVRIGEQIYPLTLHIQEREYDDKQDKSNKNAKKKDAHKLKKRWHVFLEFDLDELGMFASDISVEDKVVKTTLWVQKTPLWQASHAHIDALKTDLENSGVTVDSLVCQQGKAPDKEIRIAQSLVDIRT